MPHTKTTKHAIDVGDPDFDSIMRGLDEAQTILNGTADPTTYRMHQVRVPDVVDVKKIRKNLKLTQEGFAARYGFSPGAVKDWEQDRKTPDRSNRILLTIIERRPEVIDELLSA